MLTETPRHQLPDQGYRLVQLAHDVAGERGAAAVAAEVDRVRHPGGELVQSDMHGYRKPKDGPLHLLGPLLSLEAIALSVWAESGFGMMQRRSARKQAETLCRTQGVEAATDWTLAEGTKRADIGILRDMLGDVLSGGSLDADFFRRELHSTFRKWK
jgi:hypothetical protein